MSQQQSGQANAVHKEEEKVAIPSTGSGDSATFRRKNGKKRRLSFGSQATNVAPATETKVEANNSTSPK